MNPFDFFDVIYCINLPRSMDRKEHMSRQFESVGILDRVQWIYAPPPPPNFKIDLYKRNPAREFGVSLSQITAVVQSMNDNRSNMLVFEDDVEFVDGACDKLQLALNELPENWSCFHLGCTPNIYDKVSKNLLRLRVADGMYAYALNGHRMMDFFKYWTYGITHGLHSKQYSPIDSIMTMFLRAEKTRYCTYPYIVQPTEEIPSTISGAKYKQTKHHSIWEKVKKK